MLFRTLLQRDISAMLYFLPRPQAPLLPVDWTFLGFGAGSWSYRGKQVPNVFEGDLSLNATSGRVIARASTSGFGHARSG